MVTPVIGLKVYNFVPSDYYKCNIGIITEYNSTEFVVEYKDGNKIRYDIKLIKDFTLHG